MLNLPTVFEIEQNARAVLINDDSAKCCVRERQFAEAAYYFAKRDMHKNWLRWKAEELIKQREQVLCHFKPF